MASLISGPKAPEQPQVVYVPQSPSPRPTGTTPRSRQGAGDNNEENNAGNNTPQSTTEEKRAANILTSRRGRAGTIKTGFRGILQEKDLTPNRKTLLGE